MWILFILLVTFSCHSNSSLVVKDLKRIKGNVFPKVRKLLFKDLGPTLQKIALDNGCSLGQSPDRESKCAKEKLWFLEVSVSIHNAKLLYLHENCCHQKNYTHCMDNVTFDHAQSFNIETDFIGFNENNFSFFQDQKKVDHLIGREGNQVLKVKRDGEFEVYTLGAFRNFNKVIFNRGEVSIRVF